MKTVVDFGVPPLVLLTMLIVGTPLSADCSRWLAPRAGTAAAGVIGPLRPMTGRRSMSRLGFDLAIARGHLVSRPGCSVSSLDCGE
jgi:hypothetical protein